MAIDIQKEFLNIMAWLGFISLVMVAHHFSVSPIFTDYGIRYVIGNMIGLVFGIIAGKYLYAWYTNK